MVVQLSVWWLAGGAAAALAVVAGAALLLWRARGPRRRAAAAEARLRDAIESLSDGLLLWDADDRLVLVNPAVQRAEARRGTDRHAPFAIGATFETLIGRRVT